MNVTSFVADLKGSLDLVDWDSLLPLLQQNVVIVLASIFLAFSLFFFLWIIYNLITGRRATTLLKEEEVGLLMDETSETPDIGMETHHVSHLNKNGNADGDKTSADNMERCQVGYPTENKENKVGDGASKKNSSNRNSATNENSFMGKFGKLHNEYLNETPEKGVTVEKDNTENVEGLLATIKRNSFDSGDSFQENIIDNLTTCRLRPYIKYNPDRFILTIAVKQADIAFKSATQHLTWKISMTLLPVRKNTFTVQPNATLTPIFKQTTFDILEIHEEMLPELSLRYRLFCGDVRGVVKRLTGEVIVELGSLLTSTDYLIDDWKKIIVLNTEHKKIKNRKENISFNE